ncbi:Uncharacterized protein ChrSV_2368 [Chromobacterium vaccinii]|nr:Uncharacterized protein ChrSW_2368 [Chromobacterium vaccinii]QND89825.1 Uncharacterized protein ChrSV_2368 [Chromobacterium vaccinii]
MKTILICAISALLFATKTMAAEKVDICAKYRLGYGWSNPYKVSATSLTGTELNAATSRADFDYVARYVVIFWGEGQAREINLGTTCF